MSTTAADRAARERIAQGLPPHVEDHTLLARVAAMLESTQQLVEEEPLTKGA